VTLAPVPLQTPSFSVGGVSVQLGGANSTQLECVRALLSGLFALERSTGQSDVQLRFSPSPSPERTGRTVYSARALTVTRAGDAFSLSCGLSQLHVTPGSAEASCFLAPDFFDHSPFEQREFFLLALLMLLRPHGLYGLHACGLTRSGVGLLIVGASGSGKTTTSLNLIRGGWSYLSDDAVLLGALTDGSVRASAFRRGFSCTPETLTHFPELTGDPEFGGEFGGEFGDPDGKRVVYPGDAFGNFAADCVPSLLVFPTLTAAGRTILRPLLAAHSLIRLSQQSAGIMTDTAVSQRQLALLKTLTDQARSYELHLGRDALADPDRIGALLKGALEEAHTCVS
jgi:hypothetical protein